MRYAIAAAALIWLAAGSAGAAPTAAPDFLATNARAAGVVTLPGLQYKVLASGPAGGVFATRQDDVTVRYEGRLTDGTVFDTSPDGGKGTTVFPLKRLIPGWVAAVQLMRPGDVWMLYLPPNLAYGAKGVGPIPPDATLVFKIELVSAAPHVEEAK